jgi:hypothetical protein
MYRITVSRKVLKSIQKMPESVQVRLANLVEDLRDKGPVRLEWPNFSQLGKDQYHCHLAHKWVACWHWEKRTIEIEVYYAGSRENAPY